MKIVNNEKIACYFWIKHGLTLKMPHMLVLSVQQSNFALLE